MIFHGVFSPQLTVFLMSQNFFFNNTIVILDEFRGSAVGLQELLMQTAYPNVFVAASLQEWEKHHTLIPDLIICEFGPESCNAEDLHHCVMERGWNCKLMVYSSRDRILALPEYVLENVLRWSANKTMPNMALTPCSLSLTA